MNNNGIKRRIYKQIKDKEQLEYFKNIVPNHFTSEISDLFYKKYGIRYKKWEIENIKRTYGLYSNVSKCNKGQLAEQLKDYDKRRTRKIGEERIVHDKSGIRCVQIKVGQPSKWVKKSRYVWEQHYGKIPKDKVLIFKDGNRLNCDINNLALISKTDRIIFNYNKLNTNNEELLKTNLLLSQLMQKHSKLLKQRR